ncbi:hypothetical protein MSPP1_004180 [Malassezia sp. CBS 17886]|nr:hypothetical protein MSPP1_004180 [Malassezia sp. CBS 17886]
MITISEPVDANVRRAQEAIAAGAIPFSHAADAIALDRAVSLHKRPSPPTKSAVLGAPPPLSLTTPVKTELRARVPLARIDAAGAVHARDARADNDPDDNDTDEETGVIRCICRCDDDDGFTIQCDRCLVWQHCACFGMSQSSVPEEYLCEECDPRPVDAEFARTVQRRRIQDEARKASSYSAHESAAASVDADALDAAWSVAVGASEHTPSAPAPDRRRPSRDRVRRSPTAAATSPTARSAADAPAADGDAALALPRAKASASRRKPSQSRRKPSASISRSRATERPDDPEEEAYDRLEPWQIEFSYTGTNIVRQPGTLGVLARHLATALMHDLPQTRANAQGFQIAPLLDTRTVEERDADAAREDDDGDAPVRYTAAGLAAVGNECIPVEMRCASLQEAAARTHVRLISEQVVSHFFSNIMRLQPVASEPQHVWSASKTFCRPVMHGVFADAAIPPGAFICEYRGELYSADDYRADRINQYAHMGTPKPHVHLFPPPLNMALDARRNGTASRFVRASCHPNAVLRPVLHYADEAGSGMPQLVFGVFALAPIARSHEITVGWEWDDAHLVHLLPDLVQRPWSVDAPRVRSPAAHAKRQDEPELDAFQQRGEFPYASTILASKYNAVVSVLLGTATCGCVGPSLGGSSTNAFSMKRQNCAVTQMLRIGQGMALLQTPNALKTTVKAKPIMLAPLVGAWRGWYPTVCGDAEFHLRAKLAQDGGFVQRVVHTGDAFIPLSNDTSSSSDADMSLDGESDMESVGHASSVTEVLSDGMEFASDTDDPLVAKAMKQLGAADDTPDDDGVPFLLPLKKRTSRTRIKARVPMSESESDGEAARARPLPLLREPGRSRKRSMRPSVAPTDVLPTGVPKRLKVHAQLDAAGRTSTSLETTPLEPALLAPTPLNPTSLEPAPLAPLDPTPLAEARAAHAPPPAPETHAAPSTLAAAPAPTTDTPAAPSTLAASPLPPTPAASPPLREPRVKLSLAEYKKRLASRRQSAALETTKCSPVHSPESAVEPPGVPAVDTKLPSYSAPVTAVEPLAPARAPTAPSSGSADGGMDTRTDDGEWFNRSTRGAIRSTVIPRSPRQVPQPLVPDTAAAQSETTPGVEALLPNGPRSAPPSSFPRRPLALRTQVSVAPAPPSAPPGAPPPGPPPPMPPSLRAAKSKTLLSQNNTLQAPHTPPGMLGSAPRSDEGFRRGGWRPVS